MQNLIFANEGAKISKIIENQAGFLTNKDDDQDGRDSYQRTNRQTGNGTNLGRVI